MGAVHQSLCSPVAVVVLVSLLMFQFLLPCHIMTMQSVCYSSIIIVIFSISSISEVVVMFCMFLLRMIFAGFLSICARKEWSVIPRLLLNLLCF